MMVGKYFTDDLLQDWYLRELGNARKVLEQFNLLNQLFDGFKDYENKQNSIKSLAQMEDSIKLFDMLNWSRADLNQFK
jgi:hypothetical protein